MRLRHGGLAICSTGADFFIHVDAKADLWRFTSRQWPPSVRFVADRVPVRWGGFSVVEATLRLLRACLATGEDYLRVVLLSGACYPIKPVRELYELFALRPDIEFIRCSDLASAPREIRERGTRYWYFDRFDITPRSYRPLNVAKIALRRSLHLLAKPFRKSIDTVPSAGAGLAFGNQWWAVTIRCARHFAAESDQARWLRKFLATSLAPDEIYFHTLAASACPPVDRVPYCGGGVAMLSNLHLIDPSLTKIYAAADYEQIRHSDRYFVRKVETRISTALLDRISRELLDPQADFSPLKRRA